MSSYLKLGALIKMVTLVDFYEVKLKKKKKGKKGMTQSLMMMIICRLRLLFLIRHIVPNARCQRGRTQRAIADSSQLKSWKSLHSGCWPESRIINKCDIIWFLNYRHVQRLKCPIFNYLVRKLCANKLRRNLMNFITWGDNCTQVCFI